MLAAAKHSDILCLTLRNSYSHLDASLQKETSQFTDNIKSILQAKSGMKQGIDSLLAQTFNLRIKALKWISGKDHTFIKLLDTTYPEFEKLVNSPSLHILGENILFALRQNHFVVKALFDNGNLEDSNLSASLANLPEVTYHQFLAAVTLSAPDSSAQKFVDWMNTSLYIEVISLAAIIIYDEQLLVSQEKIVEMAHLISQAGKDHLNLAIEAGLLRNPKYTELIQSEESTELLENIQQLISTGTSFDFLNEEEELYTVADLKKIYNG